MQPFRRVRLLFVEPDARESRFLNDFFRQETVGGVLALSAAAIALIWANSPAASSYAAFTRFSIGPLDVHHWAADGALALFFLVVGLEVKREFVVGSLRRPADAVVPVVAAVTGVAIPALLYLAANLTAVDGRPAGWAIPAATDIAFALAVLAVVGSNLPPALRAFLLTMAVVDDLIVIAIIAVFMTDQLHLLWLIASVACFGLWALAQRLRWTSLLLYLPLACLAWWCTHESGLHATIAGVALGLLTRARHDRGEEESPAERLEHRLGPLSSNVAVPFFALAAAGVSLSSVGGLFVEPVAIGVFLGLVAGKPLGVLLGAWTVTRVTHATLSPDITWRDVVGVAVLAGVGFTVSLLVAELSFADQRLAELAKTAVLVSSLCAALVGALILRRRDLHHAEA